MDLAGGSATMDVIRDHGHLFLGSRLKRLADVMQTDLTQVAQQAGIPIQPGQYPLLATLEAREPQTIGELAQALGMSQPAVSKIVERLVDAGLVDVSRGDTDRRQKRVLLSAAGRRTLERSKRELWPMVENAVREVTDGLSGPLLEQVAEIEARLEARPLSSRVAASATPLLVRATEKDLPDVVALMNLAYRGRGAEAGWTHEADLLEGQRTSVEMLRDDMAANPDAAMLLWRTPPDGTLIGCVWLAPEGDGVWYLGSLSIHPHEQDLGLGRTLMVAAEAWVRARAGREIRMTVLNVRDTLLAWYERRGYQRTGETEPFPYGDDRFGVPTRDDLHFVVLHKGLT
jgi:DNA-binding MarR family transcriptional regulator/ribosomal protein S18 acetylase RimI-like enzyme